MADTDNTVELPLRLHVSPEASKKLAMRAASSGTDIAGYVSQLVEQSARRPQTLEEISGPVYQRFLESGMTDEELGEVLEREKHAARAQRRARRAS